MEAYLQKNEIFQYKIIETNRIPFSESVVEACRANRCGKYATCWTCPPGVGTLAELQRRITSYEKAAVFTCKYDLEDCFDFEGMTEGAIATQKLLLQIVGQMKADGVEVSALGCEGCILCEKCTYPDAPCRYPDKAIPSVEACGINVVELARNIGLNYNNGSDTVTYFCIILTR